MCVHAHTEQQCSSFTPIISIINSVCAGLTHIREFTDSGVRLYSEKLGFTLSNNSLVSSANVGGKDKGIACQTAAQGVPEGDTIWKDTNGETLPQGGFTSSDHLVLYKQTRPERITLYRGGVEFLSENEGVFTCRINDEHGVRQTLLVGIYTPETLATSGHYIPPLSLLFMSPFSAQVPPYIYILCAIYHGQKLPQNA